MECDSAEDSVHMIGKRLRLGCRREAEPAQAVITLTQLEAAADRLNATRSAIFTRWPVETPYPQRTFFGDH